MIFNKNSYFLFDPFLYFITFYYRLFRLFLLYISYLRYLSFGNFVPPVINLTQWLVKFTLIRFYVTNFVSLTVWLKKFFLSSWMIDVFTKNVDFRTYKSFVFLTLFIWFIVGIFGDVTSSQSTLTLWKYIWLWLSSLQSSIIHSVYFFKLYLEYL